MLERWGCTPGTALLPGAALGGARRRSSREAWGLCKTGMQEERKNQNSIPHGSSQQWDQKPDWPHQILSHLLSPLGLARRARLFKPGGVGRVTSFLLQRSTATPSSGDRARCSGELERRRSHPSPEWCSSSRLRRHNGERVTVRPWRLSSLPSDVPCRLQRGERRRCWPASTIPRRTSGCARHETFSLQVEKRRRPLAVSGSRSRRVQARGGVRSGWRRSGSGIVAVACPALGVWRLS